MKRIVFVLGMVLIAVNQLSAQCAMCAATAESSLDSGSTAATGLNNGVLYLLFMPIIFVSIFIIVYFKRQKQLAKEENLRPNEL